MTAQYDPERDLEICCLCGICAFGRLLKGIKEPTREESTAAASRLETDKLHQAARHVAQDQDKLRELLERAKAMNPTPPQGKSFSFPSDAYSASTRMRQAEELMVFGGLRNMTFGANPTPKEDLPQPDEDEVIKAAFKRLFDLIEGADSFMSENNKKLALMRIKEAEILWEDT